jgi:hypothetical protein
LSEYTGHWKRFHAWLRYNNYSNYIAAGKDPRIDAELFQSLFHPITMDIFDEYLDWYKYDDRKLLKAFTTVEGFWNSLSHAHKKCQPGGVDIPEGMVQKSVDHLGMMNSVFVFEQHKYSREIAVSNVD